MKISLEYEPHDVWIGVYWRYAPAYLLWHIYVCLIPCFPIHISFDRVCHKAKELTPLMAKALKRLDILGNHTHQCLESQAQSSKPIYHELESDIEL